MFLVDTVFVKFTWNCPNFSKSKKYDEPKFKDAMQSFHEPNWCHITAAVSQWMPSAHTLLKQTMPPQTDLEQEKDQKLCFLFWENN